MLGLLAAHPPHDLANWHESFMQEVVRPALSPQSIALVQKHLTAGDLCAIVTATNSFVTAPIARALGINHLIATTPEYVNGRYTGYIEGIPSFREGKITRVNDWLDTMGLSLADFESSHFYSDSMNDLPLLECVTHPVATNPSDELRAIATAQNWVIIDLFK